MGEIYLILFDTSHPQMLSPQKKVLNDQSYCSVIVFVID